MANLVWTDAGATAGTGLVAIYTGQKVEEIIQIAKFPVGRGSTPGLELPAGGVPLRVSCVPLEPKSIHLPKLVQAHEQEDAFRCG